MLGLRVGVETTALLLLGGDCRAAHVNFAGLLRHYWPVDRCSGGSLTTGKVVVRCCVMRSVHVYERRSVLSLIVLRERLQVVERHR